MIPESHPLQQLFLELVGRRYAEEIGIRDPQVVNYVAHLLAEFCDVEQLFKIKVSEVRTVNLTGKLRRRGRFAGYRSDTKKAYVRLKAGQKMPEYAEI